MWIIICLIGLVLQLINFVALYRINNSEKEKGLTFFEHLSENLKVSNLTFNFILYIPLLCTLLGYFVFSKCFIELSMKFVIAVLLGCLIGVINTVRSGNYEDILVSFLVIQPVIFQGLLLV